MSLGPIEVVVLAFPENRFTGEILPELERLVQSDTISIVDGVLASKDGDGTTTFVEFDSLEGDFAVLAGVLERVEGLVSDEDVEDLTASLPANSSAAVLVFEHTWAIPLRDALVRGGGELVANLRIPASVVEEILATAPQAD
ncbi:MAG TPA: DUF6325 family protein [Acidimicrobiales bacterium]|jgi:Family of unknown function (DUF6325)|nr:DUF6325 family protein [Acidimicrobiales bacterium]